MLKLSSNRSEEVRGSAPWLIGLSVGIYVLLCLIFFIAIRKANQGHFIFSLDDSYIHMALAEQIAHGHYGINSGQASSPSSSVIWPFLLAMFSGVSWQPYAALGLNFLAGLGSAVLLGWNVGIWPRNDKSVDEHARRILSVVALILMGNLIGLTFIGMEHTLQVMLAGCCATGLIYCLRGKRIPTWCIVATALGPMVRYEGLGLSVALAFALVGLREWKRAAALMVASIVPLLAFSMFLRHIGLPMLPSSVLAKAALSNQGHSQLSHHSHLVHSLAAVYHTSMEDERRVLLILFLTLAGLAWSQKNRARRFALTGAAIAAGFHLILGPFGWSHRYEVYIMFFSVLVVLFVLHERPRVLLGWYVLGLAVCIPPYVEALEQTVGASHEIYLQQYQMHRFITQFYSGNVAVNDLGLVSYRRRPGQEVVDLWGLDSIDVARETNKSAKWLDGITSKNNVGVVMIYPEWFPSAPPPDWTQLGELCLVQPRIAVAHVCVTYYATPLVRIAQVREEFDAFVKTLPEGVTVKYGQAQSVPCDPSKTASNEPGGTKN
jgi:hypothetical protein